MFFKVIVSVLLSTFFLTGCVFQDTNRRKYNELSREHNQIANEALIKKDQAVDDYNAKNYQEARTLANSAKELFAEAKKISEQNKKVAEKITDLYWLTTYQEKVIQSEEFWIEMMDRFIAACEAQLAGNISTANSIAKELERKIPEYEKIQKEIDKIEEENKDFFSSSGGN